MRNDAHIRYLGVVLDVSAVLGHERDLLVVAREVVAQLPILIAARHHEFGSALVHARENALEARHVEGMVAPTEGAVYVHGDKLDVGHCRTPNTFI